MVSDDKWRRRMRMRMNYPSTSASGKHFATLWVVSAGSLVCIIACWKWVWRAWYEATAHLICVWNELLTDAYLHIFPCDPYLNHVLRYQWSNPASQRSERSWGSWSWFQESPRTVYLWNPWNSMDPARSFHLKCSQPKHATFTYARSSRSLAVVSVYVKTVALLPVVLSALLFAWPIPVFFFSLPFLALAPASPQEVLGHGAIILVF